MSNSEEQQPMPAEAPTEAPVDAPATTAATQEPEAQEESHSSLLETAGVKAETMENSTHNEETAPEETPTTTTTTTLNDIPAAAIKKVPSPPASTVGTSVSHTQNSDNSSNPMMQPLPDGDGARALPRHSSASSEGSGYRKSRYRKSGSGGYMSGNSSVDGSDDGYQTTDDATGLPPKFPKIAIIGAGVAGVATAAALRDYNIDFCVFDKHDTVGGLWADNYPGAKVQSTFDLYEYPGVPFPPELRQRKEPPAPTAPEVVTYLEEFCKSKNILDKFHFNQKVEDIRTLRSGKFLVEFASGASHTFSYVIICSGLVSVRPKLIDIPGQENFEWNGGEIIHSSKRRDNAWFRGQKVLVIGNGKSAVDAVTAAAEVVKEKNAELKEQQIETGQPMEPYAAPIQVARRATWYIPRYWFGCIQYKWALHTQLAAFMLPRHFSQTNPFMVCLHAILSPIKWLFWRLVELILRMHYRLPRKLNPKMGTILNTLLDVSLLITDGEHLNRLRKKEIDMRMGSVTRLEPGKAVLSTGESVEVDVVIMATGWKLGFETFMDKGSLLKDLDVQDDGLWLYRNIISPHCKGLFFVGSNTLTFMNIFTAYLQAYWLAGLLAKERPWPSRSEMIKEIEANKQFKRAYYPHHVLRGASIEAYMQNYHDQLCRDMNTRPAHKFCLTRPFADFFMPNTPQRLCGCVEPTPETKARLMEAKRKRKAERTDEPLKMEVRNLPKAKFVGT